MSRPWTLAVARDDLRQTTIAAGDPPQLSDGEVLLRVARVGLTANNVTYAVLGEAMRYWEFFPPEPRGLSRRWGLPPLWGFADVAASAVSEVPVGLRVYGYLPPASHLVVRPARVDGSGFRDASTHRANLPTPYNAYRSTSGDPVYRADQEDLLVLFRPLFYTAFMLADQLTDNDFYGAGQLVFSSASSKTAYAAALQLHGRGPRVVALTSPGNVAFTRSLGCYDEVLPYADAGDLAVLPTVYLDLSGAPATRATLRERLADQLIRDIAVGLTTQVSNAATAGEVFFAPVQIRKRRLEWGNDGLEQRFAEAWRHFTVAVLPRLEVHTEDGPDALRQAWQEVLAGRTPAHVGRVVTM
ncbi:DUF2855 family protein [Paractinoplanes ferrugineus]|nr:DUF2855 family protein [Actinoplanes ferrugineus]